MNKNVFFLGGLVLLGFFGVAVLFLSNPASSSQQLISNSVALSPQSGGIQIVDIKAVSSGYSPNEVKVKKGIPVELRFSADRGAACSRVLVMTDFGVKLIAQDENVQVARFTPETSGTFTYRCGMNMFRGTLIVE